MLDLLKNPEILGAVITAVLGFLKLRKDKSTKDAALETIWAAFQRTVVRLLANPETEEKARELFNAAADRVLAKLKLKRSRGIDIMIDALIEAAFAELEDRVLERQRELEDLAERIRVEGARAGELAEKMPSVWAEAEARGRARVDGAADRVQLEIIGDEEPTNPAAIAPSHVPEGG